MAQDCGMSATPPTMWFHDDMYDGQFGRTLTAVNAGMADLGEAFAVAAKIGHKPSAVDWYDGWRAAADHAMARSATTEHRVTKRNALLRASEYFRQAYFFLRHDLSDARLLDSWQHHVDAFRAATPLLDLHVEDLEIAVGDERFKAYLFAPDASGAPRPTVLMPCGYDSTAESGFVYASGALERGYQVVAFEGPGQGKALYVDKIWFRPDFAPVVTAVVDQLLARPDVRADALVLIGLSFAGYLAPQAATAEHRLAALVCNPAQPNFGAKVPSGALGHIAPTLVKAMMKVSDGKTEFFGARMAGHGIDDVGEYFTELRRYDMVDAAKQIDCPTLILECAGDFAGGGGSTLQAAMDPSTLCTLVHLGDGDGAAGHCGGIGQHVWEATVYDWVAGVLGGALADVMAE